MRVVGVQGHQHPIDAIGMAAHLLDDLRGDQRSFNQLYLETQGMLVEGFAVVGAVDRKRCMNLLESQGGMGRVLLPKLVGAPDLSSPFERRLDIELSELISRN